ncbi:hypothetical protein [Nostoc sp. UHCC 0302]|uniref:hypothetical protein n=1 Tax=Nostoc sp. UHCC 0302 TaxID=3134896 RepID=UPI00311CD179
MLSLFALIAITDALAARKFINLLITVYSQYEVFLFCNSKYRKLVGQKAEKHTAKENFA